MDDAETPAPNPDDNLTDRLLLITNILLPNGDELVASHYHFLTDESLEKAVTDRLALPGARSVTVSRMSKEELLAALQTLCDNDVEVPCDESVN